MADKQAVLYGLAVDRAMLVTYQYLDHNRVLIGNYSSGVLRNSIYVPDVTLPRRTRFIVRIPSLVSIRLTWMLNCL